MRKIRPGITAAIKENTAAREALADQLRPIDYSGHIPDEDSREAREVIASTPREVRDEVTEVLKVVITHLEDMQLVARRMLAELERLGAAG